MAIAAPGETIEREHLPDDFLDDIIEQNGTEALAGATMAAVEKAPVSLDDMAVNAIQLALERHHGNVSATARELGVSRNTLYRKLPKSQRRASSSSPSPTSP